MVISEISFEGMGTVVVSGCTKWCPEFSHDIYFSKWFPVQIEIPKAVGFVYIKGSKPPRISSIMTHIPQ